MRILLAGEWQAPIHEAACARALRELGHEVAEFHWQPYFRPEGPGASRWQHLAGRLQNKLIAGPAVWRLNRDLQALAREVQPDVVLVYRGTHVGASTLRRLRRLVPRATLASYNNDDPFSPRASRLQWRVFRRAIREYHVHFVYRHHNIDDMRALGVERVHLLRSYFVPWLDHPVPLSPEDQREYGGDVVFAGHYEPDGRAGALTAIVTQLPEVHLRLFGPEWDAAVRRSPALAGYSPVRAVRGEEYRKALCASRIALCFLSTLNRDTYTRRCFEIPACGAFLLSEYSDDLASLFREGVEAEFFRSTEELVEKVRYYLAHEDARRKVAETGRARVLADGHDVVSRMAQAVRLLEARAPQSQGVGAR